MDPVQVAFQGETGAFSELAAHEYFHGNIQTLPCRAFEEVFKAVSSETVRYGMLPIENSLAGSVHSNYDLLLRYDLHIVGEYHLRVNHCLLALPSTKLKTLRQVYSHPQALAQCRTNLVRLGLEPVAAYDTAGSARLVRERGDPTIGALASQRAAEVYHLAILAEDLEDNPANYTRFLVLAHKPDKKRENELCDYKTSVVFTLKNHAGSLFKALSVFALRDIDLMKIESRPIPGQPWEYLFYVDFAGHSTDLICQRAISHLEELAPFMRLLGSYPRHRLDYEIQK
jgi:prephenate dehydratase